MCVRLLFNFSAFVSVALSWAVTVTKEKGAAIAGPALSLVRPNEPLGDFVICRRTLTPPSVLGLEVMERAIVFST